MKIKKLPAEEKMETKISKECGKTKNITRKLSKDEIFKKQLRWKMNGETEKYMKRRTR